jgi:hypothetical protein
VSGMMEILLIAAIVLAIFILPRMMARNPERDLQFPDRGFKLTGRMRLAIMASLVWPAIVALFLKPWNSNWPVFLYVAVGPVALTWGVCWVLWGFKKEKK